MAERLRIGEVAERTGVSVETLRFYERRGLLEEPERSDGGHRVYGDEAVRIVGFIRQAQDLGFSLAEIADLLRLRRGPANVCPEVRTLAEAKVAAVREKIRQLQTLETVLTGLVLACRTRERWPRCVILETLADLPLHAGR